MAHSDKILAQQVVSACDFFGVNHVVISPGSRNAPLIIEFNQNKSIKKYSIVDERSAGFFALGMAKTLQKPVALVCSSGSALLNYYPAIAEAYYSRIPLVVISADRPEHLIDIGDGQTIRQKNVFANHIGFSANMRQHEERDSSLLQSAFNLSLDTKLPFHINVPFDEPLYQTTEITKNWDWRKPTNDKDSLLDEKPIPEKELDIFAEKWNKSTKKMIVVGEYYKNEFIQIQLEHLTKDPSVIILTENTSNVVHESFINSIDQAIFPLSDTEFEAYKPDILITFGGMIVSKKIKQLLRKHRPNAHWHISKHQAQDTFHSLTHHFPVSPELFFSQFFFMTENKESNYHQNWVKLKENRLQKHKVFLKKTSFSDLKVFELLNQTIPNNTNIQFSNSSTIRYAQLFSWDKSHNIGCNRGTSGIDGATSTAVGVAVASKKQTVFITGDISFFYDSNALWNKYIPNNFRIILINNQGGGIFKFIPGPETTNTLEYFETPHQLTAKQLCDMHKIDYIKTNDKNELTAALNSFYNTSSTPKLLEIFTPSNLNAKILKEYFSSL